MSKLKTLLVLSTVIIVGLVLRLYHNTDISLWHDEAFSALLIKYPWGEMMHRIGLDVHPPMYYIGLRFWHYLFGDSLLALRGFSILFGLATVLAAYAFVKAAFKSEKAAIITAVLVALSPFQIQYATEARMYTFGTFFAVLGSYFLIKALEKQRQNFAGEISSKAYMWHYLGFSLSMSVAILTHYYLLFSAAAACLFALLYHLWYYRMGLKKYLVLLGAYLLIALSFLPWLKVFLFQYKQVGSGYWIPPMDRWSIPATIWQMFIGLGVDIQKSTTKYMLVLATMVTLFIVLRFLWKTVSNGKWLTLLMLAAPFGGAILFLLLARLKGEDSSVYLIRYFLFASTFLTAIVAVWISNIRIKSVAWILFAVYAASNVVVFAHYWQDLDIKTKPGMNKASEFLEANVGEKDKLYVGSSFEFFNLKYYISQMTRTDVPTPLLFSGGNRTIESMPHYAGTAILTNEDLVPNFSETTKSGDTVWLLWTNGFGGSKPETPANWSQVDEQNFAEVRPYVSAYIYITEYKVN